MYIVKTIFANRYGSPELPPVVRRKDARASQMSSK